MIQISVNTSYPGFKGLDLAKIRVVVGSVGIAPSFYPFITRKADFASIGDAGTNDRIFDISVRNPMFFTDEEFVLLGSYPNDTLLAGSTKAPLVDMVRRGILTVTKDGGAPMTYVQVLEYSI